MVPRRSARRLALPLVLVPVLALLVTACAADGDDVNRGPSGKADADIADVAGALTGRWSEPKGGTIEFTSGGALTGMDGCNTFEGSWTGTESALRLKTKSTSDHRCVAAPTLPVTAEMNGLLDGDTLKLRNSDGDEIDLERTKAE
ncbi:MAG: hypothetical protein JWM98_83 [Thermoleophilia bacterium]|nr:hypothetical protein [Thermoleophilia bacterium]